MLNALGFSAPPVAQMIVTAPNGGTEWPAWDTSELLEGAASLLERCSSTSTMREQPALEITAVKVDDRRS